MDMRTDYKEGWVPKNWCFWTVVLEKTLKSPLDCKEIKPVSPKEINPECSLEDMMLKLQYFGHLMGRPNLFKKALILEKNWRQKEKGKTEDEMVGWHHWFNEQEFEQALGDGKGHKPGVLQSMVLQRVGHNWVTEQQIYIYTYIYFSQSSSQFLTSNYITSLKYMYSTHDTPLWS